MTSVWSVVLAGGSGKRLAAVTNGIPKQYWRPKGGRSLLEETLARIAPLADSSHTMLVVDRSHHRYLQALAPPRVGPIRLWYQPSDRGTAVGVLMALGPILESVEDGIVLLTPSDHGVSNSAAFHSGIRDVIDAIDAGITNVVLFGVAPSESTSDYGWIVPGEPSEGAAELPVRSVKRFAEKPNAARAEALFRAGALWNTMVLVAKASALIDLYRTHLPCWAEVFARHQRLPLVRRQGFLEERYTALPAADFSRDILTPAEGLAVYAWPSAIGWTDLGTPERLARWLNPHVVFRCAVSA